MAETLRKESLSEEALQDAVRAAGVDATEPSVMPPAEPHWVPVPNKGLITISVMLATIMQALDTTIANVALPRVQGTLSATQDEMGWVLTSYIVAAAITIPLTGWLASEFGRRKIFLISIVVFTIASVLCGLATSLPQMVFFRFLQGVGGAALVPLSQAVLFDINPPKELVARCPSGESVSPWGRSWGPRSVAGSPKTTVGGGCSSSTCRWACWRTSDCWRPCRKAATRRPRGSTSSASRP